MTEDEIIFLNLLKIVINDIESGRWTLKDFSFNMDNNWEYIGNGIEPTFLKSKIYNVKFELE